MKAAFINIVRKMHFVSDVIFSSAVWCEVLLLYKLYKLRFIKYVLPLSKVCIRLSVFFVSFCAKVLKGHIAQYVLKHQHVNQPISNISVTIFVLLNGVAAYSRVSLVNCFVNNLEQPVSVVTFTNRVRACF